jgi:hypothetical protein
VLPQVISESQIFVFKFWFGDSIRYGMYHQGELFCRLGTYDVSKRPQVYQFACKLTQKQALTVITSNTYDCSLWGSLRSPLVKDLLLKPQDPVLAKAKQSTPIE